MLPMLWLYALVIVVGGWLMLKMLGNEREHRRGFLEHHNQVRLYHQLCDLKRRGLL